MRTTVITLEVTRAAVIAMTLAVAPASALAEGDRPVVHPIYSHLKDAPQNDLALQRFSTATRRFGLGPVEIVDIDGDPEPKTAEKLQAGINQVRKLDLAGGQVTLDDAAAEIAATGGGGLLAPALSDLYLYRAWAVSRFDFNSEHVPAPTVRAQAYEDLVRAAMLAPGRQLNLQQFPPLLLEDWARAVADVGARPQGALVVKATPEAQITCDGGAAISGPATFVGLAQGQHLIHVDEPGWAAWGATVSVDQATVEISVPTRRALTLDDADAAARARRMGTKFALIAEPQPGKNAGLSLSLRLVDAAGARRDSAVAPIAGDEGALDAAVMRLDEQARRSDRGGTAPLAPPIATGTSAPAAPVIPAPVLVAPPPERPRLGDDPGAWARDHWPLVTAVGVMVGTALILSIRVASDHGPPLPP